MRQQLSLFTPLQKQIQPLARLKIPGGIAFSGVAYSRLVDAIFVIGSWGHSICYRFDAATQTWAVMQVVQLQSTREPLYAACPLTFPTDGPWVYPRMHVRHPGQIAARLEVGPLEFQVSRNDYTTFNSAERRNFPSTPKTIVATPMDKEGKELFILNNHFYMVRIRIRTTLFNPL